jgi:hypothetical protein
VLSIEITGAERLAEEFGNLLHLACRADCARRRRQEQVCDD